MTLVYDIFNLLEIALHIWPRERSVQFQIQTLPATYIFNPLFQEIIILIYPLSLEKSQTQSYSALQSETYLF